MATRGFISAAAAAAISAYRSMEKSSGNYIGAVFNYYSSAFNFINPSIIRNHQSKPVESFEYICTTIHKRLNLHTKTDATVSKAEKRLFFIKQLAKLKV